MKLKVYLYVIFVSTTLLTLSACSDNEDGGKPPVIDQKATTTQPLSGGGGTGGGGTGGGGTGGGGTGGGGTGGGGTGGGGTGGGGTGGGGTGGGGTTSLCPFADSITLNTLNTTSPAGFYEGRSFTHGSGGITIFIVSYNYIPSATHHIDDYVEILVAQSGSGLPVDGRIRNLGRLSRTALMNATPLNPICVTSTYDSGDYNNDFGVATSPDNIAAFLLNTIAGPDWKTTDAGRVIEISFFTDGTNAAIQTTSFDVLGRNGIDTDTVTIRGKARFFFQQIQLL